MAQPPHPYVSRGGVKLAHALDALGIDPAGLICADLGCSTGGFTDVLLRQGAAKVYAVDTGYGVLDWRLRNDPRVVVMERTSAMHVVLPEPVSLVTIDAGWTRQEHILPHARTLLGHGATVVTLIKPHYEASAAVRQALRRTRGVLPADQMAEVMDQVRTDIQRCGFRIVAETASPIRGSGTRGNREFFACLEPA